MTSNVLIAFGGVALLGVIGAIVAWVAYSVANRKEPPPKPSHQPSGQPRGR